MKKSRVSRYPNREGSGRPENLRRGCSGGDSGTPRPEVKTPERDPAVTRTSRRACPNGSREAKGMEAQGRKASRVMSPRMLAKTLEGNEAQEGSGRKAALNEACMRYGSTAGARP
jgi:hypothetical protein